jgi:hypothetical protein
MSYTRSYRQVVSGSRTVSVSYPASEGGGSRSVTVDIDIPVDISIAVDTRPFDRSVALFAGTVNALGGSVVATGAAQTQAIAQNSQRIATRILGGFFALIRSELAQQIADHRARCETLSLKLQEMMAACRARKSQMEEDFARTADRYTTLFRDFDRELAKRVRALDGPAFTLHTQAEELAGRAFGKETASLATVAASEGEQARTKVGLCSIRHNGLELLRRSGEYLASDRRLNQGLRGILGPDECGSIREKCVPVLYAEMEDGAGAAQQTVIVDASRFKPLDTAPVRQHLSRCFRDPALRWSRMDGGTQSRIETFLRQDVARLGGAPGSREARIAAMVMQLWQAPPAVLTRGAADSR